jgi:hypothetical protein
MRIALDFDGTFTLDRDWWSAFIMSAQSRGHTVDIVTIRHPEADRLILHEHLENLGCLLVYCDGEPKEKVAERLGIKYDVWIDDRPRGIIEGTDLSSEQLAEWRKTDGYARR